MRFNHGLIERNSVLLLVLSFLTVTIGGIAEIVPLFAVETTIERVKGVRPYTPLELAGRNIYIREGCYLCHSQQIRPFRDEYERYGHYSLAAIGVPYSAADIEGAAAAVAGRTEMDALIAYLQGLKFPQAPAAAAAIHMNGMSRICRRRAR